MQEIQDIIDSYTRKKRAQIQDMFALAEVTANRILTGLSSKSSDSDLIRPWDLYPELFENRTEELQNKRELLETEKFKAQFNRRVEAWNKRFKKEMEDGSGEAGSQSDGGDNGRPDETEEDS